MVAESPGSDVWQTVTPENHVHQHPKTKQKNLSGKDSGII